MLPNSLIVRGDDARHSLCLGEVIRAGQRTDGAKQANLQTMEELITRFVLGFDQNILAEVARVDAKMSQLTMPSH